MATPVTRLSEYLRRRIVTMRDSGDRICDITRKLQTEDKVAVSARAVRLFLRRYDSSGSLMDRRTRVNRTALELQHLDFIDKEIDANRELTASELRRRLSQTFKLDVSLTTVKRAR